MEAIYDGRGIIPLGTEHCRNEHEMISPGFTDDIAHKVPNATAVNVRPMLIALRIASCLWSTEHLCSNFAL